MLHTKFQGKQSIGSAGEDFCRARFTGKRDIVFTIFVWCICVRPCISESVRLCPDHNLYIYAWISKQFVTVVAFEEEKCHLKHFKVG